MVSAQPVPAGSIQRRRRSPFWLALIVAIMLVAGIGLSIVRQWQAKPTQVVTEKLEAGPVQRVLAINGRITPRMQVNIGPTVGGRLALVTAREGDVVKAGDLLASLDDTQQRAAVAQADAALDGARATLQQAKIEVERAKGLGDAISRKSLDAAQLAAQTAQNDVDRLSAAQAQAISLLAQYTIKAPFDGTVLVRGADPGQVVSSGTVLFTFADTAHLMVEASIDELYSAEIRRGLPARLQPSGYNRTLQGEVSSVSPTVDTSTGGRLVRVAIDDTQGLSLPIGLTVNLNILVAEVGSAVTVPRSAILDAATAPAAFVVENGKAVRRPIEFIDWPSSRLIVGSGLKAGDVIITDPKTLADGASVAPAG
jgi:HlyD family secretion protein